MERMKAKANQRAAFYVPLDTTTSSLTETSLSRMERVDRGERTFVVVAERGLGSTTVWSRLRYQLHHQ